MNNTTKLILYTGGTFDLFHSGHVEFLKTCKNIADEVVVSLNTDIFIKKYKNKTPVIDYDNRKKILLSCRYVDKVIENIGEYDAKPAILQIKPHIIAVGSDWAKKNYYKQMKFTQQWLDDMKISLIYIPYTNGISSSMIRKKIIDDK